MPSDFPSGNFLTSGFSENDARGEYISPKEALPVFLIIECIIEEFFFNKMKLCSSTYNITSIYIFLKILYLIITTGMSFSKRLKFFSVLGIL